MERKGLFKGMGSSTAARCRLQAAKVRGNACAHQGAVDEEGRRTEGGGGEALIVRTARDLQDREARRGLHREALVDRHDGLCLCESECV